MAWRSPSRWLQNNGSGEDAVHLQLNEEMVESLAVADKLIPYIRKPNEGLG